MLLNTIARICFSFDGAPKPSVNGWRSNKKVIIEILVTTLCNWINQAPLVKHIDNHDQHRARVAAQVVYI
jgi:hypothetical protein